MARHHPSNELLLAYAAGNSAEAVSLVVATHLALCPACRAEVAHLEALGGAVVEGLSPSPLPAELLQRIMSRIDGADEGHDGSGADRNAAPVVPNDDDRLPQPLRSYLDWPLDQLPWQSLGPVSAVALVGDKAGPQAHLLRVESGTTIPWHSHAGLELVLILAGGMRDEVNCYRRGDVSQADSSVTHEQVTEPDEDCLCLLATDGPFTLTDLVATPDGPRIDP
ncbi:MAG: ChrR family anti-sigma-E factor [Kiloniellales bacterium]